MPAPRRSLLLACQSTMAAAVAAVLCLPAMSVVALEIVPPVPGAGTTPRTVAPRTTVQADEGRTRAVVATEPVRPHVEEVDLRTEEVEQPAAPRSTVLTRPIRVEGYATVGITWSADSQVDEEDLGIAISTSEAGRWTDFEPMAYDPDHEPDPGSAEARRAARPGTDALVVGEVDAVRVRVRALHGELPADLELAVVDPGVDRKMRRVSSPAVTAQAPATGPAEPAATNAAVLSAATAPRPAIRTRDDWGANESWRDKGSLHYGTIRAGFVHHTVNSNGYDRDEVPSIIRGIYAYHTQSRGWSDIGYNFLVDRFGTIWEGRYGGVARPVVGAHTLGYNEYSFAMSAIGNFDITGPPSAMLDAYARLFAWKLSLHGVSASSLRQKVGSRYFAAISGHRDAGQTACPGRYLYAKIPDIRSKAARIQKGGSTSPPPDSPDPAKSPVTNLSGAHWPDVASRRSGELTVNRTGGQIRFRAPTTALKGWGGKDLVAAAGDLNGDRFGDVVARDRSTKEVGLFAGDGKGDYASTPLRRYDRLAEVDTLVGVGDFDGDGNDDLVGRFADDHRLVLFPGRDGAGLRPGVELSPRWDYPLTAAGGDLDGDDRPDLVARKDGRLFLVRGLGNRLAAPVALSRSWAAYDLVSGGYDLSGDGRDDLLVRERSSKLSYIFPGDGKGELGRRYGPFGGFAGMRWMAVGGQLASGKGRDVVGVTDAGALQVVPNSGRQNLGRTILPDVSLRGSDSLVAVGDWNKDGRGDLMYRDADSGRLMFLANRGKETYADPVVAGSGFGDVKGLVAAGDVSGDGRADLMGVAPTGVVRVYEGDGNHGFDGGFAAAKGKAAPAGKHRGVVIRRPDGSVWLWRLRSGGGTMTKTQVDPDASAYDWFLALGDADGDGRQDVLARSQANGWLWLIPVTADGFGTRRFVSDALADRDLAGG